MRIQNLFARPGAYLRSGTSTRLMKFHQKTSFWNTQASLGTYSPGYHHEPHHHISSSHFSTNSYIVEDHHNNNDPTPVVNMISADDFLHKKYTVRRIFTANSNAQVMLTCGGESLAAHASFDPLYSRARTYIRNHPVGPAVLSPILISGLSMTLIEATLPQSIFVKNEMRQHLPLIVGVEVEASIEVVSVKTSPEQIKTGGSELEEAIGHTSGHELEVKTQVKRVRDGAIIADGSQTIWLPHYI